MNATRLPMDWQNSSFWQNVQHKFRIHKQLQGHPSTNGYCNGGIWLVQDRSSGRLCIMKVFTPNDIAHGFAKREIDALQYVRSHSFNNINQIVSSIVDPRRRQGALFVDYCDQGNVTNLIKRQQRARRWVPESFIWHVFKGLANAIRYLTEGPPNHLRLWNTILHRDITPANVFLAAGNPRTEFPLVVLGDFGCSVNIADICYRFADPNRVERQLATFAPPEAPTFYSNSDVFQVGLVVLCLCTLESDLPRSELLRRFHRSGIRRIGYSNTLESVLTSALQADARNRIGPLQLWRLVREKASLIGPDRSGMILV